MRCVQGLRKPLELLYDGHTAHGAIVIMPMSYRDEAGGSECTVLGPHRRSSWTMSLQSTALLASLADRAMRSWRSAMSTATRTPVRPMPACLVN